MRIHGLFQRNSHKIVRLYDTVRYMSARQWFYRIRNTALRTIPRKSVEVKIARYASIQYLFGSQYIDQSSLEIADRVMENEFPTISGIFPSFSGDIIDWDLKDGDYRLVCFRLNSFKYILNLSDAFRATNDLKYVQKGLCLIENWNKQCGRIIKGDKWNPYVIAERIMNWIGFFSTYNNIANQQIVEWIASQAIELKRMIEYQMGANHLLSEAKALMYVGVFLNDNKLFAFGKKILEKEFHTQFLSDGGNYERSISYHVEALQQYFEVTMLMYDIKDEDFEAFREMLIKPYVFLNSMIGADGKIPLINDSAYDYPFDACDFLGTSEILFGIVSPHGIKGSYSSRWRKVEGSPINFSWITDSYHDATGFLLEKYRVDSNEYSLFFDTGDIGADINPGHSHADSLNILWSDNGKPILVDSGVFTYKPGDERNKCRGTSAHNTIEVDNTDSSEVWSAFRVGKRARSTVRSYENTKDYMEIVAYQDGYKRILNNPVIHTRRIRLNKHDGTISIDDLLTGEGTHKATLRFHFSPDCEVKRIDSKSTMIDGKYKLVCNEPITIEECDIAGFFGRKRKGTCVTANFEMDEKIQISSRITLEKEGRI